MARLPRPSKDYDPLNMARELKAAAGAAPPTSGTAPPTSGAPVGPNRPTDYRRTLFESLFT